MDRLNIFLSVLNIIGVAINIFISSKRSKEANGISVKQLKESQKPHVALNTQLASISRSIQHLDATLEKCLSDRSDK